MKREMIRADNHQIFYAFQSTTFRSPVRNGGSIMMSPDTTIRQAPGQDFKKAYILTRALKRP